ncbi:expressed unknown protein [Seminavis robusta]|uniref:Hint domain-containing protein n=1 Tax=Seminavis robusta TaxID=568900 RepID=A0A9N8EFX7_9STRA|nr:expressed unknown protein [Seminavis robusta]|eukprot:Sro1129_g244411.1  (334) ;mRNA; r:30102-31103
MTTTCGNNRLHSLLLGMALLLLQCARNVCHAQEVCGINICAAGTPCCNPSCGICGEYCTQQFCGPMYSCFSSLSTVDVLNQGQTSMAELQVGDRVLTSTGKYKSVYAFGHHDTTTPTTFLKIKTSLSDESLAGNATTSNDLEISPRHYVYASKRDRIRATIESSASLGYRPFAAEEIRVGDLLETPNGKGARVVHIEPVQRRGMFAPFSTDGTVVVDGIIASSYVSLGELGINLPFVEATSISHLALAPFRLLCTKVSSSACEYYNDDGIPHALSLLLKFFRGILNTGSQWLYGLAALSYLGLATLAWLAECLLSFTGLLVVPLALVAVSGAS